jgi:hypothetical protein
MNEIVHRDQYDVKSSLISVNLYIKRGVQWGLKRIDSL